MICPSCGVPPVEDAYFDEQKLRMENARLKEEVVFKNYSPFSFSLSVAFFCHYLLIFSSHLQLDRVSSIAAKYIGRPISQLPPIQPIPVSSLDLTVGSFGGQGLGPSLDLDLLPGSSSIAPLPMQTVGIAEMEKPLMLEIAANAMDELLRLLQADEPLWTKSASDGREILNLDNYERIFPRPNHLKGPDIRIEATRDAGHVIMNGLALVDMFMDSVSFQIIKLCIFFLSKLVYCSFGLFNAHWQCLGDLVLLQNKWMELFPTIISKARTIEVLAPGMAGNRSGSLQLVIDRVPTFCFSR